MNNKERKRLKDLQEALETIAWNFCGSNAKIKYDEFTGTVRVKFRVHLRDTVVFDDGMICRLSTKEDCKALQSNTGRKSSRRN